MFRRMKNFLRAIEVKKFSKIQYIRNLRSGLTDTRDVKITFFVCLSFNKKIGGTWSPPRHLVRKIWHQTHVLKATAMRLEFLKNFWVETRPLKPQKGVEFEEISEWIGVSFLKKRTFSLFPSIKNDLWVVGCSRCHQSKALIICNLKHMHNFFIALQKTGFEFLLRRSTTSVSKSPARISEIRVHYWKLTLKRRPIPKRKLIC